MREGEVEVVGEAEGLTEFVEDGVVQGVRVEDLEGKEEAVELAEAHLEGRSVAERVGDDV